MKKYLPLILLVVFLGCQTTDKKDIPREIKSYTIEQFYKNERIGGGSFSPDEKHLLVASDRTGIFNAYALAVDGSGIEALTQSVDESVWPVSYFPNDRRILYQSDQGGNENDRIYLRAEDGSITDLTPWEESKSNFFGWARDEKSFFIISNKRNPQFFDLYEIDINNFESEMIYENNEGLDVSSISKDKRYLALTRSITTSNNEMYLYDRETSQLNHISEHQGDATYSPQFFDLVGKSFFYVTDEDSEFSYLVQHDIESGNVEKIYETDWDVWYAYQSYNEKYRVIGINVDAQTQVKVIELESGQEVQFPSFEGSNISSVSISKSENLMKFSVSSSKAPSNMHVYDFRSNESAQLTSTLNNEINENDLVAGKVIRYASYDGLEIPSIYYQPHNASPDNKVPALVWVHGGPGGQSRLSYFALIQYLVNHGYAVLAVNNRGSSGYGKTFFKMDDQKHGDVDLKDVVKAKGFLTSTGVIDPGKIGIIGGSYGGYMVMAALAFEPEAFDVGVNLFGVTNWLRTLKSIPPYWESFREALYMEMGDPFTEDSIRLYNISPLFHTENVTKPLMVLQGAKDPRVLQVESDEIVEGVRSNGVSVEYVLFDDEGHGFVKKENEIEGYGKILIFLDQYLKGAK